MITRLGTLCRTGQVHFVNVQIMTYTNLLLPQQEIPPEWTNEVVFFAVCWCCCFCTITAVDIPPKMLKTRNCAKTRESDSPIWTFQTTWFWDIPTSCGNTVQKSRELWEMNGNEALDGCDVGYHSALPPWQPTMMLWQQQLIKVTLYNHVD